MTHPQSPELSRNEKSATTQDGEELRAHDAEVPSESGNTAPTPGANQTEEQRRSGTKSTTLDAFQK